MAWRYSRNIMNQFNSGVIRRDDINKSRRLWPLLSFQRHAEFFLIDNDLQPGYPLNQVATIPSNSQVDYNIR